MNAFFSNESVAHLSFIEQQILVNYLKRFCAARIQESLWLSWAFVIHHHCSLNAMRLILKALRLVLCSVFQEEDICLGVSIKINIINNIYYIINVENLITLFYFPNPNPNRYLGWLSLKINVCLVRKGVFVCHWLSQEEIKMCLMFFKWFTMFVFLHLINVLNTHNVYIQNLLIH